MFSESRVVYENVEKYGTASHATDDYLILHRRDTFFLLSN